MKLPISSLGVKLLCYFVLEMDSFEGPLQEQRP